MRRASAGGDAEHGHLPRSLLPRTLRRQGRRAARAARALRRRHQRARAQSREPVLLRRRRRPALRRQGRGAGLAHQRRALQAAAGDRRRHGRDRLPVLLDHAEGRAGQRRQADTQFVDLMTFVNGTMSRRELVNCVTVTRVAALTHQRHQLANVANCDERRPTGARRARSACRRALISALGYPVIAALGVDAALARRRPRASRRGRARRPPADHGVLARPHPARHLLLPPPRHRRHHQRELRRRVDCRHHRAVRLRHGARIDVARRAQGAAAAEARHGGRASRPASRSTARAARPRVAQPGAVWLAKATGNPVVPFHIEADRHWTLDSWDRTQIPKPFATVAIAIGEPFDVPAGDEAIEAGRVKLEERLRLLEQRALKTSIGWV